MLKGWRPDIIELVYLCHFSRFLTAELFFRPCRIYFCLMKSYVDSTKINRCEFFGPDVVLFLKFSLIFTVICQKNVIHILNSNIVTP